MRVDYEKLETMTFEEGTKYLAALGYFPMDKYPDEVNGIEVEVTEFVRNTLECAVMCYEYWEAEPVPCKFCAWDCM